MKLAIKAELTLADIRNSFAEMFPLLKIEFFSKGHIEGQANSRREMIENNPTVGEVGNNKSEGIIDIGKHITVGELERAFHDRYGLNIQVFRKSGDIWLETTVTDNMTLDQQQKLAEEKMKPVETTKPGDIDYD